MKINFTNTERMKNMKKKLGILLMAATLLFAGCQENVPVNTPTTEPTAAITATAA